MNLLHYALQRSGSNYLEAILKNRCQIRFLNSNKDRSSPLQKHFRLYNEKKIIPDPGYLNDHYLNSFKDFERLLPVRPDYYLVISKDPYSWLLSYKDWAKKCNWPNVSHHYITEYNLFYGSWLEFSLQTKRILFVRYIDLLRDTDQELSRLEETMGLKRRVFSKFRSASVGNVSQSKKFSSDKREYYLKERYMRRYDKEDIYELNRLLDVKVISRLGYEKR